jgi:anti-anti-sigma factor
MDIKRETVLPLEQRTSMAPAGQPVTVLMPKGRLDMATAWEFRLKLRDCLSKHSPHVVVNLAEVDFIDSSGLTTLVAGLRDAETWQGSFRICQMRPEARLVFEITQMDSVFELFETEEEALASIPARAA